MLRGSMEDGGGESAEAKIMRVYAMAELLLSSIERLFVSFRSPFGVFSVFRRRLLCTMRGALILSATFMKFISASQLI